MPTPQTIYTVVLIIIFLLLILMLKNRFYGLIVYMCVFITMIGLHFQFLGNIRFELIVALIVLIIILVSPESRNLLSLKRSSISRNLFIFFLVVILSMAQSLDFQTAFDRTWEFAKIYALYLMIVALVNSDRDLKIFLWSFVILMALVGYEPIYNFLHGITMDRGLAEYAVAEKGRGSGHVALGIYLIQGLCYLWYLTISKKNLKQIMISLFLICVFITGILVSGSRGALVGLVSTILIISYFSKNKLLYLIVGSLMIIVALSFMSSGYLSYMNTILDFGQSDVSAQSRFIGLRNGIDMLIKRPILGVGPGCYPIARKLWFGWGLWAHNIYGELAGDLGILGILAWGNFMYSYLKKGFDMRRSFSNDSLYYFIIMAVIVSNIVCLILGFFAHMLYGYFWYLSAAVVVVIENLLKKKDSKIHI